MELMTAPVTSVTSMSVANASRTATALAQDAAPIKETPPAAVSSEAPAADDVAVARKRIELPERPVGANKSLVMEKDPVRSGFIYKTVDRQTGQVTRVWPQEEAASALRALADVEARGAMIKTRV
jgi:hypothetical protein